MVTLLTKAQAAERVHKHPEYLMALSRQGRFPKPLKHGGRNAKVYFVAEEVDRWVADLIAARDAQPKAEG